MSESPQRSRKSFTSRVVRGPVGFRRLLLRLGPTFVKLGQYLSLRPDLLPQAFCDELLQLVDQGPSFPWSQARTVLTEELGPELIASFAYINPRPIAAGSLAQTHVGHLQDGTEVAIKIQRPNIRSQVLRDLGRVRLLARLLERCQVSLVVSPHEVIQELTEWMLQEINFRQELANVTRLHRLAEGSQIEKVPRPYPHLSSARVLTTEYLRGIPLHDVLRTLRSGKPDAIQRLHEQGIDCTQLANNLVTASLTQIFRYQFFHADLHPGNLLALPGNRIGFVDFGLCDALDATVRQSQMRYLSAVYHGETEQVFKALTEILIPTEETDIEAFRRDFIAATRALGHHTSVDETDDQMVYSDDDRSQIARYIMNLMRAARRNLQIPTRVLSMYRTLLTVEAVAHQLGRREGLRVVGQTFFAKLQQEEAIKLFEPAQVQQKLFSLMTLLRDSPSQLNQILTELSNGDFSLNVFNSEISKTSRALNRRTRLLATTILSVSVALLLTIPELPELFGIPLTQPLSIVLVLLYLWIIFQWRQLR